MNVIIYPKAVLTAHAQNLTEQSVKGARNVAPGLFSPVEAAIIHEGLISSKRRLICLNMCVVRLVCLEQQWTVSVRGGGFMPLVALMLSAPSAVVSDDRLSLPLDGEPPTGVRG